MGDPKQVALALYDGGQADIATMSATLGNSPATFYRDPEFRTGEPPEPSSVRQSASQVSTSSR